MKASTRKLGGWSVGILVVLLVIVFALPLLIFPQPPALTQEAYQALFPFQGHYAELENGNRVHYVDEGE